jgi:hypothetical protein
MEFRSRWHFCAAAMSPMQCTHNEEREMRMFMRWLSAPRSHENWDSDPYLEALGQRLLLLRSGQTPRRRDFPRAAPS